MDQIIKEAFQELKMMNEDTFSFDKEGLSSLSKFLKADNQISTLNVIDPTAQTEEDLLPDYTGKVILQCCVCNQPIYANPEEVDVDEETQRVNVGEECPHCYSLNGYKVIGQVQPFVDDEIRATVDGEEVEIEEKEEITESLNEDVQLKLDPDDMIRSISILYNDARGLSSKEIEKLFHKNGANPDSDYWDEGLDIPNAYADIIEYARKEYKERGWDIEDIGEDVYKIVYGEDVSESLNEDTVKQNGKWVNKGKEGTHGTFKTKKAADAQRRAMFAQGYRESLKLNEKKQKDLWDEIYSELTFSDDQRWSTDDEGKAHNKIHQGYYDYMDQMGIDYDKDGTPLITIKAISEDDFAKAKEIADGYKDRGVTYSVNQDKYNKRFPYKLKIKVPMEESLNETFEDPNHFILEEDDIMFFDEDTGDLFVKYRVFDNSSVKVNEGDTIKISFKDDNDDIGLQSYKLIRSTEDGYWLEWQGTEGINESLKEDFTKATVETGESVLSMESDDRGKVTVTSEPRKVEESGEGILAPVSDDTKKEIESNEEESEINEEEIAELDEIDLEGDSGANEVEVEDIEEEGFNELGESYLKEVYDNVKSFKTIKGSINESKIKLEGIIEFNSGKKAKTNFIFESAEITKKGKVKFVGGNPQISKKPNAFTLQGTLKDHTLIVESLTYNYRAQDAKSNSNFSKYGTVKRKIVRG